MREQVQYTNICHQRIISNSQAALVAAVVVVVVVVVAAHRVLQAVHGHVARQHALQFFNLEDAGKA